MHFYMSDETDNVLPFLEASPSCLLQLVIIVYLWSLAGASEHAPVGRGWGTPGRLCGEASVLTTM